MRINARLDQVRSEKVLFLEQKTGQSASDIIRHALDLYYQQVISQQANPFQILEKTGFIGSGQSDADLSENYKQYLDFGQKSL